MILGLLMAGTVWGNEDQFPFGPFRMYATNGGPNASVDDPRMEGVTRSGVIVHLDERNGGMRRAEMEGQLARYVADPRLLGDVARNYAHDKPHAPPLVEVRIIMRHHAVHDSRPTGTFTDTLLVSWNAP